MNAETAKLKFGLNQKFVELIEKGYDSNWTFDEIEQIHNLAGYRAQKSVKAHNGTFERCVHIEGTVQEIRASSAVIIIKNAKPGSANFIFINKDASNAPTCFTLSNILANTIEYKETPCCLK